ATSTSSRNCVDLESGTPVATGGGQAMAFFGFLMACFFFCHFKRRLQYSRAGIGEEGTSYMTWHRHGGPWGGWDSCSTDWPRHVGRGQRDAARAARRAAREAQRWGWPVPEPPQREPEKPPSPEEEAVRRARRRAAAEAGFYGHVMTYLAVIG